jgi:antitoxin (DNA-binding transcriptional repressor) of toxin-antitoxin stability system
MVSEVPSMKSVQHTYTVKAFSSNPSRAIHQALKGAEVTITLRGVPALRLVPLEEDQEPSRAALERLAKVPGFHPARVPFHLPEPATRLLGEGPSASDMILEDRR